MDGAAASSSRTHVAADLPRLMWTLDHLQTAADAAAEAGAYGGVDMDHYQRAGEIRYTSGAVNYLAMTTFEQAAADAGLIQYSPRITGILIDENDDTVLVTAEATARIFIPAITPPITLRVSATSQTRGAQGR